MHVAAAVLAVHACVDVVVVVEATGDGKENEVLVVDDDGVDEADETLVRYCFLLVVVAVAVVDLGRFGWCCCCLVRSFVCRCCGFLADFLPFVFFDVASKDCSECSSACEIGWFALCNPLVVWFRCGIVVFWLRALVASISSIA